MDQAFPPKHAPETRHLVPTKALAATRPNENSGAIVSTALPTGFEVSDDRDAKAARSLSLEADVAQLKDSIESLNRPSFR